MDSLKIISLIGLVLYFAALLFAVTKEKKNENVEDFFFGGRSLPFWALSITFIASWWGAGSALSTADLAFSDGIGAFWYYGVPVLISTFLMIVGAKMIRRVGYFTQAQMMKARYNDKVAKFLAVMILIFMTFTAASQMVGIGDFFGSYLGLSYEFAIIIGTGIVLIYSMFGGFRGVVLTDIIQFVLLLISAIAVFIVAFTNSGGIDNVMQSISQLRDPSFTDFVGSAPKYLMYVITFGCAWVIQANVWQRISATRNNNDAKKMTVMSFFVYIPLYLIVVFTGMLAITLFDELPVGGVVSGIVLNYMPPLLGAVVFVGISAAIMSTMDSLINTAAMTLSMDLYPDGKSEKQRLNFSRYATLGVTLVALLISLRIQSILEVSWIASDIITTGVFVPLVLGFFSKRGNSNGALASMMVGLTFSLYNLLISFGINLPSFWELHSAQQVILGVGLSFVTYYVVSLLTKPEYEKAEAFKLKATKDSVEQLD